MRGQINNKYYYVLVLTHKGPVFVTSEKEKTAYWDKDKKPLNFPKGYAEQMALGLTVNGSLSFAIGLPYELDTQAYRYNEGEFKWIYKNEKEEEEND